LTVEEAGYEAALEAIWLYIWPQGVYMLLDKRHLSCVQLKLC